MISRDDPRHALITAKNLIDWLLHREASDKVRYTWAVVAAERLAEVRDEIASRLPRQPRIKIEDLPIEEDVSDD